MITIIIETEFYNLSGCFSILPATELVPGDIVEVCGRSWLYLKQHEFFYYPLTYLFVYLFNASTVGCKIPADMRMIEMLSNQLRVDQAILTGNYRSVFVNSFSSRILV